MRELSPRPRSYFPSTIEAASTSTTRKRSFPDVRTSPQPPVRTARSVRGGPPEADRRRAASGGEAETAQPRRIRGPGPHPRPRPASAASDSGRPAVVSHFLRSSRHRQDHPRSRHLEHDALALHQHQRRPSRRRGYTVGSRGGAGAPHPARPANHPFRR